MNYYRLTGDEKSPLMDTADLRYAAEIAFAGGLFDTMPTSPEEAVDAFERAGFDIEEVKA